MGGGISMSSYSEQLTKENIKEICGGVLNENLFDCIKNNENTVNREQFFKIIQSSLEQELLLLYFQFTTNSMNLEQYIKYCVFGRLLTKHTFRKKDGEDLFHRFSASSSSSPHDQVINYMILRFNILPEIAIKKGIELSFLLIKLSRLPSPNYNEKEQKKNEKEEEDEKEKKIITKLSSQSLSTQDDSIRQNAAVKIQRIQRTWLAKNDLLREKEIKLILESSGNDENFPSNDNDNDNDNGEMKEWNSRNTPHLFEDTQEEIKCHLLYSKFCSANGEMDIKDFIRLCYDTELIPYDSIRIDFTGKDAQHIFKKTLTKHFNPQTNTYREGIVHGKRILYHVFRLRILPEIATIKNMSINDLIVRLGNYSGKVRHNAHHHGPQIISLLDQKQIDDKLKENILYYGEHVE